MAAVTLVIMTKDRAAELLATLGRLTAGAQAPPVVVVDNGSSDGTSDRVRAAFPQVECVTLPRNLGVEARNIGVLQARTPYVAFNDDDSWWEPAALADLVGLFDAHPTLGAVTARVQVEPDGREDPMSLLMAGSTVTGDPALPGVPVLGFLACAAAVRREAFLAVGGFEPRLHFLGEEQLLALDLTAAGWECRYVPEVVVHHLAEVRREAPLWRRRRIVRNDLWTAWLRRPLASAARRSWRLLTSAPPGVAAPALAEALVRGGWVPRARRVVPPALEADLRVLERA